LLQKIISDCNHICHSERSEESRFFGDSSVTSLPQNDKQSQFEVVQKKKLLAFAIVFAINSFPLEVLKSP
jgi:hypothetical protein